ncbi:hypothetical protein ISCGN_006995 [Ixodes scapularis]
MVLSGRDERRSRRLDKHQLGLSSSSSGSVFPGRNHSSGSLVGRLRRHAGRRGAVLSDTGLPAPHRSGRAVAAGSQPQSLSGAPLCGGASLMVARHTAQGPRCPGGRRQAEVDTVYCEVCGGRAPQVSGELMDLSEDDPWDQRCVCACGGSPGQTKRRCSQQPSLRVSEGLKVSVTVRVRVSEGLKVSVAVRVRVTDVKKKELLTSAWTPSPTFPFKPTEKRNLKFQYKWLHRWNWLVYSNAENGAFFMADETTDNAGVEQLSLCARYVDMERIVMKEEFLQFVPVTDMTGKDMESTTWLETAAETSTVDKDVVVTLLNLMHMVIARVLMAAARYSVTHDRFSIHRLTTIVWLTFWVQIRYSR